MATAIFYKSILGSSKEYATTLAEKLHADLYEYNQLNDKMIKDYDNFIVFSGTYMGQMPLTSFLHENWSLLEDKNVIAVAVGLLNAEGKDSAQQYGKIPAKIRNKIRYIKIKGAIYPRLTKDQILNNLDRVIQVFDAKQV